ncbi:MAG: ATP-binding protein [Phyllobacterium sp.]|uniref:ATP-binding protein n=1 Tax=Phyllobacterium sp. TaxID=1871046 RepID=UPI0030F089DA
MSAEDGVSPSISQPFLRPDGELARLIASHDWSSTPLGDIASWPQSLKSTISLILHSPVPIVTLWGERGIMIYNDAYSVFAGGRHPQLLGTEVRKGWPEVADFNDNVMKVGLAGGTLAYTDQELVLYRTGKPERVWMNLDYSPLINEMGVPAGVMAIVVETTAKVRAEEALRNETRFLQILNRTGANMAAELDLGKVVQLVTDAGVALTGAQFGAFFYNVLSKEGESYMLYALSGVDRNTFSKFPMPRNTAVFEPTFKGEGVVRSDDILDDPRYGNNGPYWGMPEGHLPVRSYLAVPVTSRSGEVLGGLFFGHGETGKFLPDHETLLVGIAGQAATAIDNARLFQAAERELSVRRQTEEALQRLNTTLEQRVLEEIAERSKAEEQLRQSQKMEALGQLTGGVAHDFNNLLQIISGNLQLLAKDIAGNARGERRIENALAGVSRGSKLASQLLAFGRRQPLEPKVVNIGRFIANMGDMLRRTIGEAIEIEIVRSGGLWNTLVDPTQIENALLNLAINARDAMPDGGKLTIEVGNASLDEAYARQNPEAEAGQFVLLAVTDTGTGMTPTVLAQAFEPFFSTKSVGRGTGLGLSMVYGFVRQSGGHVKIYSEVGEGTTVKLYLPRIQQNEDVLIETDLGPTIGGSETILVAEDDEEVRTTVVEMLGDLGYRVLKAKDAASALSIIESGVPIDVLFTDVVMPGPLGSPELARKARQRLPQIAVLFTSGYTENAIVHGGRLDPGVELLSKPYQRETLARRIRHVLAARRQRG